MSNEADDSIINYSANSSIVSGLAPTKESQKYFEYSISESPDPIASSTIFKQRIFGTSNNLPENTLVEAHDLVNRSSSSSSLCPRSSSSLGVLSSKTLKAVSGDFIQCSPEKMRSDNSNGENIKKMKLNNEISFGYFDDNDMSVPEVKIDQKDLDDLLNITGLSDMGGDLDVEEFKSQRNNKCYGDVASWNKTLKESFIDSSKEFFAMGENDQLEFLNHEEEENKKKHRFIQDAAVPSNVTTGYDTSTWSVAMTEEDLRKTTPNSTSITTYLQYASCPLGVLGDKLAVRPNFGLPIVSPVNKAVALVDQSLSNENRTTIETETNMEQSIDDGLASDRTSNDVDDGNTTISSMVTSCDGFPIVPDHASATGSSTNNASPKLPLQVLNGIGEQNANSTVGIRSANETTGVLSLSAIGKLIGDMSLGANSSRLAEVILKAKEDLAHRRAGRLVNTKYTNVNTTTKIDAASTSREQINERSNLTNENSLAPMSTTFCTNKRKVCFGCVDVSQSATQNIILQNPSKDETVHLKVCLKQEHSHFRILNADGEGCITLLPNEKFQLKVIFRPTSIKSYRDRIVIKSASSNVQKFCIPVMGYGGIAKLISEHKKILSAGKPCRAKGLFILHGCGNLLLLSNKDNIIYKLYKSKMG